MFDKILIFSLLIGLPILMFFYTKHLFNKSINNAVKNFLDPYLKAENMHRVRIEKLRYQSLPFFKQKGDFDDVPIAPWSDSNFNRKIYFYLYYKDFHGKICRTTVKVSNNLIMQPQKIEIYRPIHNQKLKNE